MKTGLNGYAHSFQLYNGVNRFWQVHDGPTTDSLRLHSGNGFSGRTLPKLTLTAESGEMTVRFVTDSLRTKNGFRAVFSAGKCNFKTTCSIPCHYEDVPILFIIIMQSR